MCLNMYDVRLKDTYPACGMNWPPALPAITTYLGVNHDRVAILQVADILVRGKRSSMLSTLPQNQNRGQNAPVM